MLYFIVIDVSTKVHASSTIEINPDREKLYLDFILVLFSKSHTSIDEHK